MKTYLMSVVVVAGLLYAATGAAVVAGQIDDFEDGTTQGWVVALLGVVHPAPPVNIPDGGPQGAGDNYLEITALGGGGPGSRLAVINLSQWAGDYTAAGIASIGMSLKNLGATDLNTRLYLSNGTDDAVTDAFFLPSGGDWTHVEFAVDVLSLTELNGSVSALLSNVTNLRIFHGPNPTFPGPTIAAMLGVDRIRARESSPAVPVLTMIGILVLLSLLSAVAASALRQRSSSANRQEVR